MQSISGRLVIFSPQIPTVEADDECERIKNCWIATKWFFLRLPAVEAQVASSDEINFFYKLKIVFNPTIRDFKLFLLVQRIDWSLSNLNI